MRQFPRFEWVTFENMMPLLQLFWNICLMRESPERVPAQNVLVVMTLAAKLLLILTVTRFLEVDKTALRLTTEVIVAATTTTCLLYTSDAADE